MKNSTHSITWAVVKMGASNQKCKPGKKVKRKRKPRKKASAQ